MKEKICVIITTYGRPQYLKRAINSVLNQTYMNWELIIVDDNNPKTPERHETESLVGEYTASRTSIKYLKHESNKNGAAARNTGIRASTGDYIAFLDDDDEYAPQRLEKCIAAIQKTSNKYAGVYTGCMFYKTNGTIKSFCSAATGNFLFETLCCKFPFYSGSNLFLKKQVFEQTGLFDETFIRHQDYEFLVRVFRSFDLWGIPEVLLTKHEIGSNIPNYKRLETTKEQYLNKFQSDIEKLDRKKQNWIYYSNYMQLYFATPKKEVTDRGSYLKRAFKYHFITFPDLIKLFLMEIKHD